MRRRNPELRADELLAAWDAAPPADAAAPLTVKCRLMTPMYGGGVTPGEVDRDLPIRPGALRGQLRFWWRLLNRADGTPALFEAESELWGGISSTGPRASRVVLNAVGEPVGSERMVRFRDRSRRFPTYALILQQGDDPCLLDAGYEFRLTLRFSRKVTAAQRAQVIEALRWWACFGGVGARTRRGLGAVEVADDHGEIEPISSEAVKSRGGRMVFRSPTRTALDAWKNAIDALRDFRQGPREGRNPGSGNRPGRSLWPEPDAVRRRTGQHARGHEPEHEVEERYPRAAFGLPIVFHFKNPGDPKGARGKDLTLNPAGQDRMASPLILRPGCDGGRYRPLALLLPGWEQRVSVPVGLDAEHSVSAWPEDPDERSRLADRVAPMKGRGTDALTAFLHYFEHAGRADRGRRER